MSEPWIRVYAADMRGDPKIALLTAGERYMLIQAWDLAKNGPTPPEVRQPDGDPLEPPAFARIVDVTAREAQRFYERIWKFGLAETASDGAITFPRLQTRQGLDPTNAERQRRFRSRHRNASSNGQSNVDVTAQNQMLEPEDPPNPPPSGGDRNERRNPRARGDSPRQVAAAEDERLTTAELIRRATAHAKRSRPLYPSDQDWADDLRRSWQQLSDQQLATVLATATNQGAAA